MKILYPKLQSFWSFIFNISIFKPEQWASVTEHTIIPSATKATGRLSLWKMQEEKLLQSLPFRTMGRLSHSSWSWWSFRWGKYIIILVYIIIEENIIASIKFNQSFVFISAIWKDNKWIHKSMVSWSIIWRRFRSGNTTYFAPYIVHIDKEIS